MNNPTFEGEPPDQINFEHVPNCAIERHGATEWRRSQRGLIHIGYAEDHINLSPLRMNHQQLSYFALAEPNS